MRAGTASSSPFPSAQVHERNAAPALFRRHECCLYLPAAAPIVAHDVGCIIVAEEKSRDTMKTAAVPSPPGFPAAVRAGAAITTVAALLLWQLLTLAGLPARAQTVEPSLWVSDDDNRRLYRLDAAGGLLETIPLSLTVERETFSIAPSDLTLGAAGMLWVVAERPGLLINYSRTGVARGAAIPAEAFGARGPEGVAYDASDDTLWVVDDPDLDVDYVTQVYHIDRTGRLLGRFPTTAYDPRSTSPQAIAVDPADGTLWITDNAADRIYNVSRDGALIRSIFRTAFDPDATNLQGVAVGPGPTLWVSDRSTGRIYRLSSDGGLLASFRSRSYDLSSHNPTGVAFEPATSFFMDDFE